LILTIRTSDHAGRPYPSASAGAQNCGLQSSIVLPGKRARPLAVR
jgi:hypothetical protein